MKLLVATLVAVPTLAMFGVVDLDDTRTNLAAGFPSSPPPAGAPIPDPLTHGADGAVGDGLVYSLAAAGLTAAVLVGIKRRKVTR